MLRATFVRWFWGDKKMTRGRLVCLFLTLLFPAPEVGAQEVKLKASLQNAITHPLVGVSIARLKEEVERRSDKTLILEIFDKGQLFTDPQVVDAVSSGAVEIGTTSSQMFVRRAPAVAILDLPFLFNFRALNRAAASPGSELRKVIVPGRGFARRSATGGLSACMRQLLRGSWPYSGIRLYVHGDDGHGHGFCSDIQWGKPGMRGSRR